ncbi:PREDICTED: uncharacterized protein LOC104607995 isoform X2 [Nelumbo nucifera]|uniref:Uncharacterized protein LOC104607995 isoform X2 n=1 Tax=Nelumbo nucifera TaxID=4432 RepID=A0A1U8B809_NELNU|nr:PREDICTED: uncharacterized protein LOC104607995 isoform X2 [Nelumbo nucifera]
MVLDSMMNGSVTALSKDLAKKKRTNRTAKLKQCKLDARREQWLSQVQNKGSKEESNGGDGSPPSSLLLTDDRNSYLENLDTRSRGEENEGSSFHDSDLDYVANGLTGSTLEANDSGKDRPGSSSGCCSGNVSEEEEDDWEAVADALTAEDKQQHPTTELPAQLDSPTRSTAPRELVNKTCEVGPLKPQSKEMVPRCVPNGRAWRPDDAFRPQSLPNLSKQHSFPMYSDRHCGHGAINWACHNIMSQPSSCPICYEDLDLTDSSFLPCSCGFRLCLFCHKRILEADGRCPGCRKQYGPINEEMGVNGGALPLRLGRSCSMNTRILLWKLKLWGALKHLHNDGSASMARTIHHVAFGVTDILVSLYGHGMKKGDWRKDDHWPKPWKVEDGDKQSFLGP